MLPPRSLASRCRRVFQWGLTPSGSATSPFSVGLNASTFGSRGVSAFLPLYPFERLYPIGSPANLRSFLLGLPLVLNLDYLAGKCCRTHLCSSSSHLQPLHGCLRVLRYCRTARREVATYVLVF